MPGLSSRPGLRGSNPGLEGAGWPGSAIWEGWREASPGSRLARVRRRVLRLRCRGRACPAAATSGVVTGAELEIRRCETAIIAAVPQWRHPHAEKLVRRRGPAVRSKRYCYRCYCRYCAPSAFGSGCRIFGCRGRVPRRAGRFYQRPTARLGRTARPGIPPAPPRSGAKTVASGWPFDRVERGADMEAVRSSR